MKKEILIVVVIFLILTITMHYKEFIEFPIEHIKNLSNSGAYGLGFIHPLFFTLFIYLILWLPRFILRVIKKGRS